MMIQCNEFYICIILPLVNVWICLIYIKHRKYRWQNKIRYGFIKLGKLILISILYLSAVPFSSFVYYISIYIYPSLISGVHKCKARKAAFGVITRFQQVCKVTFWNDKNITECWSRHVTSNKVSRSGERNINQRYSFVTTRCSDADKSRTRPRQYNRCQQIFADGTYISISILGEEIQDSFR